MLYMVHYVPEPLIQVALKKVKGLCQVGLYPLVVKLVSPDLLVLQLFHSFAQTVGLPSRILPLEFRVLDHVVHSALKVLTSLLGVREGLGSAAHRILSPTLHSEVASFVAVTLEHLCEFGNVEAQKTPARHILFVPVSHLLLNFIESAFQALHPVAQTFEQRGLLWAELARAD